MANLGRGREHARVVAEREHLAFAAQVLVDPAGDPHREPFHRAHQRPLVLGFDE
jgi:hypothetical protein